ncbi:tyrosine-protein phosphatase [Nonomuraea sp. NPDC004580]|uniref:tyrosine-protein phosphatase n=1 Tax=Nonomuraea sp. NPDC004580 TaxID=3154552 RepID=UPI0033BC97FB
MNRAGRTLRWPECDNVRDLGGLPVAGGGRIRPGALVRGDRPRQASVAAMLGHGVRLVVDLRSKAERAADPGPSEPRITWRHLPVLREEDAVLEEMADTLAGIYRRILDHGARSLAAVVSAIAHAPPGATLVHCHSGKDRTGLAIALTLTLAGVAAADVAADYAETAARMSLDAHLAALPGEAERARSRRLFAEVGAGTMLATLAHLDDRYGGAAAYLREGGLPPADLALLRTRLTTDP